MAKILVEIVGDARQFERSLDKATGTTRKFGAAAKVAGGLVVTGLLVGLEQSVKAAIDAQDSQRRLAQAFKNTGLSLKTYAGQIEAAQRAGRKLGFTDTDVRDSLGSLLTATGDVRLSMNDLAVAQDLARFKGVDLETATRTLTSAMSGSQRAIKQLGIGISPVTTNVDKLKAAHVDLTTAAGKAELAHAKLADKMATGQAVIAATGQLVKGQGQAYAETAAGGMAQFHAQLDHFEVTIGKAILPALTKLLQGATDMAVYLNDNLGPAFESAKEALGHFKGVAELLGKWLKLEFQAALLLTKAEIKLVQLAVAGMEAAFKACKTAAAAVATFFTNVLHGAMAGVKGIATGLDAAVDGVGSALKAVKRAGETLASWFAGGATKAFNAFKEVASNLGSMFLSVKGYINGLISAVKSLIGWLGKIHAPHISIPGKGGGVPFVPGIASGGVVTRPTLAMVGEAGPEAIIPLSRYGGGAGSTVIVNVAGSVVTEGQLIDAIHEGLLRKQGRNGGLGFAT